MSTVRSKYRWKNRVLDDGSENERIIHVDR
jgi:hypothetical protein